MHYLPMLIGDGIACSCVMRMSGYNAIFRSTIPGVFLFCFCYALSLTQPEVVIIERVMGWVYSMTKWWMLDEWLLFRFRSPNTYTRNTCIKFQNRTTLGGVIEVFWVKKIKCPRTYANRKVSLILAEKWMKNRWKLDECPRTSRNDKTLDGNYSFFS